MGHVASGAQPGLLYMTAGLQKAKQEATRPLKAWAWSPKHQFQCILLVKAGHRVSLVQWEGNNLLLDGRSTPVNRGEDGWPPTLEAFRHGTQERKLSGRYKHAILKRDEKVASRFLKRCSDRLDQMCA